MHGVFGVVVNEQKTSEVSFTYDSKDSIDEVILQLTKIVYPTIKENNEVFDIVKSYYKISNNVLAKN